MDYFIIPYEGVGNIKLGMTSDQISRIMSIEPRRFLKYADDEYSTDAYDTFYVYYKNPGICEAIEFFQPSIVSFKGVEILKRSYSELEALFSSLDEDIEIQEDGLTSYKTGISIYAPSAKTDPKNPPEGVLIFERGYYG